jgi:hypothetical protein
VGVDGVVRKWDLGDGGWRIEYRGAVYERIHGFMCRLLPRRESR